MELFVVEQAFAVTVVILQIEELVVAFQYAERHIDDGVEIQVPALSFYKCHSEVETTVVGYGLETGLKYAGVFEYVLIVHAVDNRNP